MKTILKLFVLTYLFLDLGLIQAQDPLNKFVSSEALKGASISLSLVDLETGEPLQGHHQNERLCPASVWKLFTTSVALESLGPEFKFRTILAYDGILKDGILEGDLILVGSGDPSLGSKYFGDGFEGFLSALVRVVKEAGIDSISGNVIVNSSHFLNQGVPGSRTWEDIGNYYGTMAYGFNIADNSYNIEFSVPDEPELPCEIQKVLPEVPDLNFQSEVLSSSIRGDRAFIFGAPFSEERIVRGTLPVGSKTYTIKGSVPDPAKFGAFHIFNALKRSGIGSRGSISEPKRYREISALTIIKTFDSPSLNQMVKHINQNSDNLFAEAVLLQMGAMTGNPTTEGGLDVIRDYLSKDCTSEYEVFGYDGSGLSRFTSVSSEQITCLLSKTFKSKIHKDFLIQELPLAGKEGTMKWFGRNSNLDGNLRAKSGSMDGVKAYAGLFNALSGRLLGFAVLINNYQGNSIDVRKEIEQYLLLKYGDY